MEHAPDIRPASETYYREAASWSADVHGALRASRQRAWWVAGVAATIALVQAIALVLLLPLKTVVPYTITVDRQTGAAQPARSVDIGALSGNEALIQSMLAQYVIARETLDAADLAANYRKVGLWSAGTARSDYLRSMDRSNPASVLTGADSATRIVTTIKSISLTAAGAALVRFATDRREGDGPIARRDWAAVIGFGFSDGPLGVEDRLVNPLGFQVSRYRRDPETLTPQIIIPTAVPRAAQPETPQ
jgi:type IV secretion system protein VirB8